MDRYEFKLRSEEIEKLMKNQKYADAAQLADSIDWRRVKSASTLARIGELYRINRRYQDSRNIYEFSIDRNPNNKSVVYALCEVCLELNDIEQATNYYKDYVMLAPGDPAHYILRYHILDACGSGYETKIELLEELKRKDRVEEMEYELAYLYHRQGLAAKCVETCDDLILWFVDGPTVVKAMELKMLHEPLTPSQQEKYDMRNEEKIQIAAQAARERNTGEIELEDDFRVKTINMGQFNTIDLQAELAENLKAYIDDEPKPVQPTGINREDQTVYHNTIPADAQEVFFADQTADMRYQIPTPQSVAEATPEMEAFKESFAQEYVGVEPPQSVGQLIEAFDEGTQEIPAEHVNNAVAKAAVVTGDTARVQTRNVQEIRFEEEGEVVAQEIPGQQSFMGNMQSTMPMSGNTGAYERLLSQDKDGQISLAGVNEERVVEKQITGQLNIQDILADWEKMKKEREQKMQEEVRQTVLQHTGKMFTDFDASYNTDILASLGEDGIPKDNTLKKGLENHAKQVIVPGVRSEEVVEKEPVIEELTEELIETAAEEIPATEATVITPEEEPEESAETIVSQFTGDLSTTSGAIEQVVIAESVVAGIADTAAPVIAGAVTAEAAAVTVEVAAEAVAMDAATEVVAEAATVATESATEGFVEETVAEEAMEAVEEIAAETVTEEPEAVEEIVTEEVEVIPEEVPEEAAEPMIEEAVAEEEPAVEETEAVSNFATTGEGNFYGSVTEAIPGGIWREVDGYAEDDKTEVSEEASVEEYNIQEQDDVVSEDEQEATEHKDLTNDEKELFKPFLYSKKMKKQILDTLEKITLAAYTGNVVITADSKETALQLAKLIVSYVRTGDDNFSGNVAKIEADKLNKKDISNVFKKLVNGALLVEDAGKLSSQTMRSMLQELNQDANGIIVILMDRKKAMDTLMGRGAVIGEFFNARMDILTMNADMLVNYGTRYADEAGYSIDNMAQLALYKKIAELQAGNHTVTVAEIKEIMDNAMRKADKGGLSKVARIITRKRYDENDKIILNEKDFD